MPELNLSLRLLTDVAFTADSATIGRHETLRYVPGAALLGAVAGMLYRELSSEDSWRIFHTSAVRFGCARPAAGAFSAVPLPLSLHRLKVDAATGRAPSWWDRDDGVQLLGEAALNLAVAPRGPGLKQLRSTEFLGSGLERRTPQTHFSMRTAIHEGTGRARDGYLFSLEALCAGQVFRCAVRCDQEPDRKLLEQTLHGRRLRLGRSRSSEFGSVEVTVEEGELRPCLDPGDGAATTVSVLLLSDMMLRDGAGQVRTVPVAADFGFPGDWALAADRTFILTRRYSPYNATRRRHDAERHVLAMGSVLTFAGSSPWPLERVRAVTRDGVGLHRNEGLGEVLVAPAMLGVERPAVLRERPKAETADAETLDDSLARWLEARAAAEADADRRTTALLGYAKALGRFIGRSQWGQLRAFAVGALRHPTTDAELRRALTNHLTADQAQLSHRWGRRIERGVTVADTVVRALGAGVPPGEGSSAEAAAWLLDLATQAMRTKEA